MPKIDKIVVKAKPEPTFDLEVEHPDHQFYLSNGALTSNSHAVAYAIDSYMCAWLLTHYQDEWLCAYLESMSRNPEDKAKAFGEIRAMGYQIVPIDINHAGASWTILPGKKFMPSFLSCKGVGESAIDEIVAKRPYKSVEDMLWNEDGTWKHSKFNKKALESLVKIGAFGSLGCVGEDKLFKNYHVMHEVVIENNDLIKKTTKKEPGLGRKNFYDLARKLNAELDDWTREDRAKNRIDVFGSLDASALVDPQVLDLFEKHGVRSLDEHDGTGIYWFCVQKTYPKMTKNKRPYLLMEVVGTKGKLTKLHVWSWDGTTIGTYAVCYAEVSRNDFGFSTSMRKVKVL